MLDNKVNIFRTDQDLIRIRLQLLDLATNFGTLLLAEVPLLQSFEAAERESFEAGLPDGVVAWIAPDRSRSENDLGMTGRFLERVVLCLPNIGPGEDNVVNN